MVIQSTRMRKKGQITVPAAIREALDLQEGDVVVFEQDKDRIVFQRAANAIDRTAGIFKQYARGIPDPAAERAQFEQDLADEVYEAYKRL